MSAPTPLADLLARRIAKTGPISLAQYMADCLLHPDHGYYTTRDPLGRDGDFTTAPEISQMFGEVLGLCLAQSWVDQGCPAPFTLAELGPGRGTLMADILRATKAVPNMHTAMNVTLVEASPTLRDKQREKLSGYDVTWVDTVAKLPQQPLFLIANEFFDALPIRQFMRDEKGWREAQVGLIDETLTLGLSQPAPIALLDHRLNDTQSGDVVEICPTFASIIDEIAQRITTYGGSGIVIDYGDWHAIGDTFQAVENHEMVDPLARPGCADLTAHVDFEALALCATDAGCAVSQMIAQGPLLARLGIAQRAQALATKMSGTDLDLHFEAFDRLTNTDKMGLLFKAIAIAPRETLLPPGFDAPT
ncbi:SAM-dependent MidA family methyltransferase [Pacificibacter maritimus]|uniref:SAM-dependent MidA family methyltransferase n=1 Tax=Pacificibacter maritimus TaxID=762213 RepID=A0A3N4UXT4_9RHOB|nr:SAM-dependent methyltransferase [Pacificibacter maritimus]RPE66400.1 SAM-dependent MidA family methyltransferase [Pacificibacter maritimus]